jgi:hypothetical protein
MCIIPCRSFDLPEISQTPPICVCVCVCVCVRVCVCVCVCVKTTRTWSPWQLPKKRQGHSRNPAHMCVRVYVCARPCSPRQAHSRAILAILRD